MHSFVVYLRDSLVRFNEYKIVEAKYPMSLIRVLLFKTNYVKISLFKNFVNSYYYYLMSCRFFFVIKTPNTSIYVCFKCFKRD